MRKAIVAMLVVMLLGAGSTFAQKLTGGITIQITDPSGKAVSDVKATVTSKDHGNKFDLVSNDQGVVAVPDLAVGVYEVSLQHDGFRTVTANVTVRVGVMASLDIHLEIGSISSSVMVEANAVTVDTDKSTVQGVIQSKEIQALPLNGRNFLDLAQLAPGVQIVDGGTFDPTKNQMVGVSVGGRSGRSTRIQVDGVDITDETVGTTVLNLTNESIQEFGVSQSSLDVSTDLTSSGAVNILTKTGTNDFHGTGFGFFRRSDFAANNAPLSQLDPPKPVFSRDNYGGSLSGPFIKNKWFWTVEYEKLQQVGQNTTSVPAFPQFTGAFGVPVDEHMGSARTDFNLTNNQHLFYRYNHDDNIGVTGFGGVGLSAFGNSNRANFHVVGWDYTKANWVNQIRFSFLKFLNGIVDANPLAGTPVAVDPAGDLAQVNITGLGGFVYGPSANAPQQTLQQNRQLKYDASWTHGKHTISFGVQYNRIDEGGFASFFANGPRVTGAYFNAAHDPNLATDPFSPDGADDPLNFKLSQVILGNGLGFGSELPALGLPHGGFHNNRLGIYLHDTWRATNRLTFNAGLRYDRDDGVTNHDLERSPLISTFDPELGGFPRVDNFRLGPQAGFAWNINGDGKTVIRGGGGIYYETNIFNNILFDRALNLPPGLGNGTPVLNGGLTFIQDPTTGGVLFDFASDCTGVAPSNANPNSCLGASIGAALPFVIQAQQAYQAKSAELAANWPVPGIPLEFNSDYGTDLLGGTLLDPHYKSPYGAQLNIGIQRQIKPGLVFTADYVLNRGVHFNMTRDRNRLGAANSLNVAAAQAAITRTLGDYECDSIDCVIENGGSIFDFSAEGLGAGSGRDGYAFSGSNPNFRAMNILEQVGLSRYQGLQTALTGKLGSWGPFKSATANITYSLSRFNATGTDSDFLPAAIDNDFPTRFYGPSDQDRLHQFGASLIVDLPFHFTVASTNYYRSAPSSDLLLFDSTAGDASAIFLTDLNGDGTVTDPLPGTNHGSFDRSVGLGRMNQLINNFNSTTAGTLSPAAQALVDSGLFTSAQLSALGAVIQPVATPSAAQLNNPNFFTSDIRVSWMWKFKERLTVQPMAECFNIFNRNNWAGTASNNGLSGSLSGGAGTVNGTDAKFQRVGNGSGSFSSGTPRAFQFGIRVSF